MLTLCFRRFFLRRHHHHRWTSTSTRPLLQQDDADPHIVKSPLKDVEIPEGVTVAEYIQATMGPWGDKVVYESMAGKKLTFDQVFRQSRSFGAALIQAGFRRGDVIAIVLQNVPEYASVQFGIWEAGLIASPVNPNYTVDEIHRQLNTSGAKGIVTSSEFLPAIRQRQVKEPWDTSANFVVCVGPNVAGCHSYDEMVKTDPRSVTFPKVTDQSSREDTVMLPFSSGTTGPPKGVMLTHYNLVANLIQASTSELAYRPRLGGQERPRLLGVLPFFHAYGYMVFLGWSLHQGARTMCIPKFETTSFLEAFRHHRPTQLHLVPPLMSLINSSNDYGAKELETVECILVGAAPVGPSLIESVIEKKGGEFYFLEGYGMTELSPLSHIMRPSLTDRVIGSCGVPIPNTITKLIDPEDGKSVGRNRRGELCIKGPQLMKGYFNNEEATRHTIDSDGWLHTGDIAYYDDANNCYIVDRIKELIKVKGFQVAPSELEDLLRNHDDVTDVAVIGVPHPENGEAPRAYIVRRDDSFLTPNAVHEYLKPLIAPFKQLKGGIQFVTTIPKAPSGKLLRRELRAEYNKTVQN